MYLRYVLVLMQYCRGMVRGYPQPGGEMHPPIPSEGVLGEVLGGQANLALRQARKNTRSRVVRAARA